MEPFRMHDMSLTNEIQYSCNECKKMFGLVASVELHMKTHDEERAMAAIVPKRATITMLDVKPFNSTQIGKLYKCSVCEEKFSIKDILGHLLTHPCNKPVPYDLPRRTLTGPRLKRPRVENCQRDLPPKRLQVENCQKLPLPTRIGGGRHLYACDICTMAFSMRDTLKVHYLTHAGEKEYVCHVCHAAFTKKKQLERHLCLHPGACDLCNKSFSSLERLEKHLSLHGGKKPHICSECGKLFRSQNAFKLHLCVHAPGALQVCLASGDIKGADMEEKQYDCHVCYESFHRRSDFQRHLRSYKHRQLKHTLWNIDIGKK